MKRTCIISHLLLAMVLVALPICDIHARRPENYISLSVAPGYSNLITHDKLAKPYGFLGGIVGLGYEMHAGAFWWSMAAEAECFTSSTAIDPGIVTSQTANFAISRWRDCPHYLLVGIPVMFGYQNDKFYFGIGPKALLTLYNHYSSYICYANTTGESFRTVSATNINNNLITAAACFEIGGILFSQSPHNVTTTRKYIHPIAKTGFHLKLGFYAEYGFMNINAAKGTHDVVTIADDRLSIISLYNSNTLSNNKVTPFFAGIRLTLIYGR